MVKREPPVDRALPLVPVIGRIALWFCLYRVELDVLCPQHDQELSPAPHDTIDGMTLGKRAFDAMIPQDAVGCVVWFSKNSSLMVPSTQWRTRCRRFEQLSSRRSKKMVVQKKVTQTQYTYKNLIAQISNICNKLFQSGLQ